MILLSQKIPNDNDVNQKNLHTTGTLAKILQIPLPDGTKKVLIEGKTRAKALHITDTNGFWQLRLKKFKPSKISLKLS